jgi:hypothetical protein
VVAACDDGAVIALIIIAALAVLFVVLIWVKSEHPENEEASLGHNSPWPDSVFGPSVLRPQLGSPETLESHSDPEWVDAELRRSEQHRHRESGD